MGGVRGQATDIQIEAARDHQDARARSTGSSPARPARPSSKVVEDTERNFWMSAEEAIDYGMCDRIVQSAKDL